METKHGSGKFITKEEVRGDIDENIDNVLRTKRGLLGGLDGNIWILLL